MPNVMLGVVLNTAARGRPRGCKRIKPVCASGAALLEAGPVWHPQRAPVLSIGVASRAGPGTARLRQGEGGIVLKPWHGRDGSCFGSTGALCTDVKPDAIDEAYDTPWRAEQAVEGYLGPFHNRCMCSISSCTGRVGTACPATSEYRLEGRSEGPGALPRSRAGWSSGGPARSRPGGSLALRPLSANGPGAALASPVSEGREGPLQDDSSGPFRLVFLVM